MGLLGHDPRIHLHIYLYLGIREKAGEPIATNPVASASDPADQDDGSQSRSQGKFSGFAALSMQDDGPPEAPAEDEDFGGLMVRYSRRTTVFRVVHAVSIVYPKGYHEGKEGQKEEEAGG